jgi:hypothetical protein
VRRALLFALVVPLVVHAQGQPRLTISLPDVSPAAQAVLDPPTAPTPPAGPEVQALDVLAPGSIRDYMRNGFPARLHFHVELWRKGGLFDELQGSADWQVVAYFDPLTKRYRAARIVGTHVTVLGDFDQPRALDSAVAHPYTVPLMPRDKHQYYYTGALDVNLISLSDLDEVERWLHGELTPAVRGQRNAGGAVGDGLRTFFLRLIGAERRHYESRSKVFSAR